MPVIYKPCQSTIANRSGKELFYLRVKLTGNVDTNTVAREIAELSSLTSGDVKNVIDNLITVVTRHLQSSESVTLDGFGSFRYALKTTGGGVENATDVSASLAQLMVRFLPACRRNTDGTRSTRSLVDGAKCVRFDQIQGEDIPTLPDDSEEEEEDGGGGALG